MAIWAHRCLPEKNRLTATDAERVEETFQARLSTLAAGAADAAQAQEVAPGGLQGQEGREAGKLHAQRRSRAVNKSLLPLAEPRRVRDRDHVRAVAKRPCLICGRQPSDAHHLRFAQSRAFGRKVSDEFTVPLCRGHHRELHRCGDEEAWWKAAGIDPTVPARALWLQTHPLLTVQSEPTSPKYGIGAQTAAELVIAKSAR
jgi:hypothetical protein